MRNVVVIPTYNEKENAEAMARAVLDVLPAEDGILFVDDNSPDGTGAILDRLAQATPRVQVLHRERKEGLGRAYIAGFRKALELGAQRIVEMDCDFSHPVQSLSALLASEADVTIGSRYMKGGRCEGWPFKRWLVSRLGGLYIRFMTGLPVKDPTGGFKAFRREVLAGFDWTKVKSMGYSFQLEMNYLMWKAGATIREVPIVFTERRAGKSKITPAIARETLRIVGELCRFRRK